MFSTDDTIVAIATPAGRGGIGVVRISGSQATHIAARILSRRRPLQPRLATLTRVAVSPDAPRSAADHVLATWFEAPHSYTGEHVVEVSAHGSPVVLDAIVARAVVSGARLARPGEFTLRAFLNGRLDLVQAEAVGDLIAAVTPLQARAAFDQLEGTLSTQIASIDRALLDLAARLEASLDFPEEGFHFIDPQESANTIAAVLQRIHALLAHAARGRMIREGATVAIVGRTNVGKSTLFNALIGQDRAIVTDVPGTTRDFLTEKIEIDGLALTLIDTAGLRQADDAIEREGVDRAMRAREASDLVLVVIDSGEEITAADRHLIESSRSRRHVVVASKADRTPRWHTENAVRVSVAARSGLDDLRRSIVATLTDAEMLRDSAAVANVRHIALLREAAASLCRAQHAAGKGEPEEFVLGELHQARATLSEIVGAGADDEVLNHIFTNFCIGK